MKSIRAHPSNNCFLSFVYFHNIPSTSFFLCLSHDSKTFHFCWTTTLSIRNNNNNKTIFKQIKKNENKETNKRIKKNKNKTHNFFFFFFFLHSLIWNFNSVFDEFSIVVKLCWPMPLWIACMYVYYKVHVYNHSVYKLIIVQMLLGP